MNLFKILLLTAATVALLVLAIAYGCYRSSFYASRKEKKEPEVIDIPDGKIYEVYRPAFERWAREVRAMKHEEVSITSFDGLTLYGKYYEYAPGAPIELMFHGYRGNAERDLSGGVQRCFQLGRSALIVDQRCSGKSGGHVITFGVNEHQDCLRWVDFMVARFGTAAIAASQASMNFAGFVYMLPLSVSMSMTILIGIEAGARRWINAEQYANVGLAFNWTCALILPSLCFLLRYSIAGMYVTEPEVIGVCVRFIAYSCLFIMGDAVAAPIQGILRGYKDVNAPFYSSLIAYWVICMPLGLFLDYRLGHGPYSYWQSLDIGLFFSALILLLRLKYVRKKMREEE